MYYFSISLAVSLTHILEHTWSADEFTWEKNKVIRVEILGRTIIEIEYVTPKSVDGGSK